MPSMPESRWTEFSFRHLPSYGCSSIVNFTETSYFSNFVTWLLSICFRITPGNYLHSGWLHLFDSRSFVSIPKCHAMYLVTHQIVPISISTYILLGFLGANQCWEAFLKFFLFSVAWHHSSHASQTMEQLETAKSPPQKILQTLAIWSC